MSGGHGVASSNLASPNYSLFLVVSRHLSPSHKTCYEQGEIRDRAELKGSSSLNKVKKVYLESLGCNKNTVDSEIMLSILKEKGFERTNSPEDASAIIVNTCAFIDPAKEEAISAILELGRRKREGARLIVAGCLPQIHHRAALDELPEVDAVVGVGNLEALLEAVEHNGTGERDFPSSRFIGDSYREYAAGRELFTPPGYAYLKISEGCSRACSFCIIPAIRGKLRSRAPDSIVEEAKQLEKKGVRELVLTSQDTLGYGLDIGAGLDRLVERLLSETGISLIRLLYLRPGNELLRALGVFENERVLRYFDIPVQHVSKKVLRDMNRGGDHDEYIGMVDTLRTRFEDAVLRTTLIVGFPGEGAAEFELLQAFVEEARFDHLGVFLFSPQEGTAAFSFKGRVGKKTAEERKKRLLELQRGISRERLSRSVGRDFEVLVEERVAGKNLYLGRSRHFAPEVDGVFVLESARELRPGDLVWARVTRSDDYDLHGTLLR